MKAAEAEQLKRAFAQIIESQRGRVTGVVTLLLAQRGITLQRIYR